MLNIAVETIRMYEREGIFLAEKTETGRRIFNDDDVRWLNCIRRFITEQGLNIEGIRRMLALMPCWELRPCTTAERDICPAFQGAMVPCWMIKAETAGSCQSDNCRTCHVYLNAIKCENLKSLLFHFNQSENQSVR